MYKALLIDHVPTHAERLAARIQSLGVVATWVRDPAEARILVRQRTENFDLIIVNVSNAAYPWLATLRMLNEAAGVGRKELGPLLLCVSTTQQPPDFVLTIEELGARYACER